MAGDARSIIAALRDGQPLSAADLRWFADGLADGRVSDAQGGAFAMAALLRGMGEPGRVRLTEAMRDSGDVLTWNFPAPVVDKHSTGGIGDSISLLLAPALAACGVFVPMVSGRGLGHTGGTLDKLEAIPGFRVDQPETALRRIVRDVGCAIVSASSRIAPADRRLYAIRDVTATVESIDLITASILSKKLAAGLDALILDVKVGSGAFLPGAEDALALARALVQTANDAGCRTAALITDMDRPLSRTAGNGLEVGEVMTTLTGTATSPRLIELSVALGGALLELCGAVATESAGATAIRRAIAGGAAAECFGRMIAAQGGPSDFLTRWRGLLPEASVIAAVRATSSGVVTQIDTREVGMAVVRLGGGRLRESDRIAPEVGFSDLIEPGASVAVGDPLAMVHARTDADAAEAIAAMQRAVRLGTQPAAPITLVQERIG